MTATHSTAHDRNPSIEPVRKEVELPCPPADAFRMFTAEIGRWWPLATHSLGGESARDCAMDPRPGGHFYETDAAGTRQVWGTRRRGAQRLRPGLGRRLRPPVLRVRRSRLAPLIRSRAWSNQGGSRCSEPSSHSWRSQRQAQAW